MGKAVIVVLVVSLILLLAWSPWMTAERAGGLAVRSFVNGWQGVMDGCGVSCKGCGIVGAGKTLFGARVELEYACGMLPADTPEYHLRARGFVSAFGTVHGLPKP
jgi:hypothetical protein